MASSLFNMNMTALIQQVAEKHNLTLCSTVPDPTSSSLSTSTSYLTMSASVAVVYIAMAAIMIRTVRDRKALEAKDTKINALKASNTKLVTLRERFRGRIVQLFGEATDFKRILLGHEGMGVPLRITIDGKTVIVRIDREIEQQNASQRLPPPFEEGDALLTTPEADVYGGNQRVRPARLRVNTAVDRTANQQDIPPAPSPAGEGNHTFPSNTRFRRNVPDVEYSDSFGHRYIIPATRSAPSAELLQNRQMPSGARNHSSFSDSSVMFFSSNAELPNEALHRHRRSSFNNPDPAQEVLSQPLPADHFDTVPNTPRPELEAHDFPLSAADYMPEPVLDLTSNHILGEYERSTASRASAQADASQQQQNGSERSHRNAYVEDEGIAGGDEELVTQSTTTDATEAGTVTNTSTDEPTPEGVDEMDVDEMDCTVPGEDADTGYEVIEDDDGLDAWLEITQEHLENADF